MSEEPERPEDEHRPEERRGLPDAAAVAAALDPFADPIEPVVRGQSRTFPSNDLLQLDRRYVTAARIVGAIRSTITALLLAVAAAWAAIAEPIDGWPWWVWPAIAVVLAVLRLVLDMVRPVWIVRYTRFRADDSGIEIRRGFVTRSVVTVPRTRVQHTDVSRGPIDRANGLATLVIHTAGTEHAEITLQGLDEATAVDLRDFLLTGGDGERAR